MVYCAISGDALPKIARNIVAVMSESCVKRLIFMGAVGIYNEIPDEIDGEDNLDREPAQIPNRQAVDIVEASSLNYTVLRPGYLSEGAEDDFVLSVERLWHYDSVPCETGVTAYGRGYAVLPGERQYHTECGTGEEVKDTLRRHSMNDIILNNGVKMPMLGFGTWFIDDDKAEAAGKAAVEIGYRHIDTAQAYFNEAGVGAGVRNCGVSRDSLFVVSKVAAEHKTYEAASRSIDETLEKMGLDYLDMMIIHSPQPWDEWRGE